MIRWKNLLLATLAGSLSLAAGYVVAPRLDLAPTGQLVEAPVRALRVAPAPVELPPEPVAAVEPAVDPMNPTADLARAWLLAEGPRRDPDRGRRLVSFTYDDGPGPRSTPALLRELDKHHVKATFFLIGEYLTGKDTRAEQVREAAARLVREGHTVASHGLSHRLLTTLPNAEAKRQIEEAHERIAAVTGVTPTLFRPPYGGLDAFSAGVVVDHGYRLVLWSIEAQDMVRDDEDGIYEDLRRQIEYGEGGIVLLHDIKVQTARITGRLLSYLERRRWDPAKPERVGFEVVDLETYLDETREHPQPFATRSELADSRKASWRKHHAAPTQPGS